MMDERPVTEILRELGWTLARADMLFEALQEKEWDARVAVPEYQRARQLLGEGWRMEGWSAVSLKDSYDHFEVWLVNHEPGKLAVPHVWGTSPFNNPHAEEAYEILGLEGDEGSNSLVCVYLDALTREEQDGYELATVQRRMG